MCGIFGTLNLSVSNRASEIFSGLYHRGPNAKGLLMEENVELFHTRLSIQDLNLTGRQPMHHHGLSIVFNGEIYNHMELRKEYGLHAESNSDTKTLLMLFELMGMKMLDKLDGMFAFALYDQFRNELYLARDRAGKKPLYLYNNGSGTAFSSELNILYQIFKPEIDHTSLSSYLYLGYHYRKATPYKQVIELENGHYLKINTKTAQEVYVKWFDMSTYYQQDIKISYKDALNELDSKLKLAVNRRIDSSDLEIGSFLSGGIDSGIITAMASIHKPSLKTFTLRVEGSYDESPQALQLAQKYNTQHKIVDISFSDLQDDIEQILINYGEPYCDSSAIPSYYVAKAAKKHVNVVLNGDGADELFAGYRRYVPFRYFDFLNSSKFSNISAKILAGLLPIAHEKQSRYNYFYRLVKFASYQDILKTYSAATSDIMVGFENQFIVQPNLDDIDYDLRNINEFNISPLKKLLLMDFQTILFSGLLPKMDIATMANSLEGRSPFLSKELLEFVPGLTDNYKINGFETKSILRELSKKYLPPSLVNQPKRGFEIPIKNWVNGQLKDIINDYLLSSNNFYPRVINKKFVLNLLNNKILLSEEKRAKILYNVFAMEVWFKNVNSSGSRKPLFKTSLVEA
jgi:asparagine synthase (glutamine-hydrolysing)